MHRALAPLLGLLVVAPLPGFRAQSPAQRAALDTLRDSLSGATDTVALKRLETATIAVAKQNRDDAMIHLRLGFIAYRLGELSGKSHVDDAAGEFEWAAQLHPDWPLPWYADGLAELALGEHFVIGFENLREILGKDYLSKAAAAFAKATEADPSFAQATVDLARAALTQRISPRLDLALRAAREAAASPAGQNPAVQLARGRVELAVGNADSALVAFHRYVTVGGDSGVGLLEEARTDYFANRPRAGEAAYEAGALRGGAAAAGLYRADLAWIASPAELAGFDSLQTGSDRAQWLMSFWERRDVADARAPGERLAEHYRRWFYAERNFRLLSRHRHYDITERFRPGQDEFDDRGVIYLRHGAPDRRATYVASDSVEPNETWLYHRDDGDLIFHFVARKGVQDFKLVESLADALSSGLSGAMSLQGRRSLGPVASGLFASRADMNPVYARLGDRVGSENTRGVLTTERALGQRSIEIGTRTDSYRQRFDQPLDVTTSRFIVGDSSAAGRGEKLHVVFAIPAGRLEPVSDSGRVVYPLAFRLYVSDAAGQLVASLDTARVFAARQPLPDGSYLTGQLGAAVPAGVFTYRLLVEQIGRVAGNLVTDDSVKVDALSGRQFAMSDLVVGRAGSGLVWNDRGDTVYLNPLDEFPTASAAELYYEVYGLPTGMTYHTLIRLDHVGGRSGIGALLHLFGGGARAPVTLEFDAASDGVVSRVHRRIDLRDVPRGSYVLHIRLVDPATGVTIERAHPFTVVSR